MNKRKFYNKLVNALRIDGYFMSHTNDDAYSNPYQVTSYVPINNYTTMSPINFTIRCNRNIVSIYERNNTSKVKLDDNLLLLKEVNYNSGYSDNMVVSTVRHLKELASEHYYLIDDVIEFYRDNGVELLGDDGTLDMFYFDQVISDTFIYSDEMDAYLYVGWL